LRARWAAAEPGRRRAPGTRTERRFIDVIQSDAHSIRSLIPAALAVLFLAMPGGTVLSAPPAAPGKVPAPEVSRSEVPHDPIPFGPGESFRFAVKFGFVRAGEARLSVEGPEIVNGETAYRLVSTAESSRFFSTFFPVHDRVVSIWSPILRLPLRFEKHIREGKYAKDVSMRFDHVREEAIYPDGERVPIPPGTQDVLSAFYYVRTLPLSVGKN
jgi:hypothetical protein